MQANAFHDLEKMKDEILQNKLKIKEPVSDLLILFIQILRKENSHNNLKSFEQSLFNSKKDKFNSLRQQRHQIMIDYNKKMNELNQVEKNKTSSRIIDLRKEVDRMEKDAKEITNRIDDMSVNLTKCWDELFLLIAWMDERPDKIDIITENKDLFIQKYYEEIQMGYPIHILRGVPLRVKSQIIESIFDKIKLDNIFVICVVGEQSSAKSSLLNSLFGCGFETSAGRCTIGIYMRWVQFEGKTVVILDTEGLMSVDSGDQVFDNQMATMAVLSSHLIIINHKGEISSNLERLLSITFYAKLRVGESNIKPSIAFVLRDQADRTDSSVKEQVQKMRTRLNEQASFTNVDIDSVFKIGDKSVVMMPSAFSEDINQITKVNNRWRNRTFTNEIIKLRCFIKSTMEQQINSGSVQLFKSMTELYLRLSSNWETLENLGGSILNSRNLEEVRVKRELAEVSRMLIDKKRENFFQESSELIEQCIDELDDEDAFVDFESRLNEICKRAETNLFESFKKVTAAYNDLLKSEYTDLIKSTL